MAENDKPDNKVCQNPPHSLGTASFFPWRFWLIAFILVLAALYVISGILLPFVAGFIIAYFLDPVCDLLERRGVSRGIATAAVLSLFALIGLSFLIILAPTIYRQTVNLIDNFPIYIQTLRELIEPYLENLSTLPAGQEGGTSVTAVSGALTRNMVSIFTQVVSSGFAVVNLLALVFLTPVVAFYLLRDWDRIVERIDGMLPRLYAPVIRQQFREVDRTLAGFIRGQALVILFLTVFYGGGFTILGLDYGLGLGVIAGLLSFVPYLGSGIALLVGTAIAVVQFQGWLMPMITLGLVGLGQFIEGNFLTPKLVGDRIGLHPVWVIFALLLGGYLFGFTGLVLAVPVAAVIGVLVRYALNRYRQSTLYAPLAAPEDGHPSRSGIASPIEAPARER